MQFIQKLIRVVIIIETPIKQYRMKIDKVKPLNLDTDTTDIVGIIAT